MLGVILGFGALIGGIAMDKYNSDYSKGVTQKSSTKNYFNARNNLSMTYLVDSPEEFEAYVRDAHNLGYIDGRQYKEASAAWTKLRNNLVRDRHGTIDMKASLKNISPQERKALTTLYNHLYKNDNAFKSLWDQHFSEMSEEEQLEWIKGAGGMGVTIPAPAYLNTDFANYQKNVEPLKLYSNKELADLYNLDYNFENIKKDYEAGAQADVDYSTWASDLIKNAGELDNTKNVASYLDAIRGVKSDAVLNGISTGARAAAEVLANKEAMQNKVNTNAEVATQRMDVMNDALLKRAQAALNATKVYNDLAQHLGSTSSTLYSNDVNRLGADLLANANFFSADENLRANRMAANNIMASAYNAAKAQQKALYGSGVNNYEDVFRRYLNANDGIFRRALSDYIDTQAMQNTGYASYLDMWGAGRE